MAKLPPLPTCQGNVGPRKVLLFCPARMDMGNSLEDSCSSGKILPVTPSTVGKAAMSRSTCASQLEAGTQSSSVNAMTGQFAWLVAKLRAAESPLGDCEQWMIGMEYCDRTRLITASTT